MGLLDLIRSRRPVHLLAFALAVISVPAAAQTDLKFSLDGRVEGPVAPFLVAHDKGYFRTRGLNVAIEEAANPLEPIARVASGSHAMGFADINALIKYRDQNPAAPLKTVFMVYNRPPYAVVARKSRGITEPQHLKGKKLGAPPNSTTILQWPLFARLNKIDIAQVTVENVAIAVRAPMLAAGQLDAALGFSFRVFIDLKNRGVPIDDIVLLPMPDYQLKLYGNAIIANAKFAADNPDAVKGFLRAYLSGLKETIRRPADAVDTVVRRDDLAKKEVELERLRMALRDNIITPEVRAIGYGAVDPARLDEAIEQLALTYTFKAKPKAADVFDPAFLPPADERKVN
jgi:NitT/TauT family transport system substrate-binding protein